MVSPRCQWLYPVVLSLLFSETTRGLSLPKPSVFFHGPFEVEAEGLHNVNVAYSGPLDGELSIHYGSCEAEHQTDSHHCLGTTHVGSHPLAKRHEGWESYRPTRFVWLPPNDIPSGGCLSAYLGDELVGRSGRFTVKKRMTRRSAAFADIADAMGPWFDGVEYLKQKEPGEVFVASAKSKSVGIIGGGMSGLMTAYLLDSVGFKDWHIIEASGRIGGRVHTSYLNATTPDQYQYQEMGPMRFPVSYTESETNETIQIMDHRMVFQLAAALNDMNGNDSSLAVNFIPWIQSNDNVPASTTFRRPDGTVPSVGEVETNPAYYTNVSAEFSNYTAAEEAEAKYDTWLGFNAAAKRLMASNVFQAHKQAVEAGHFEFSESGYLRYVLRTNKNLTDLVDSIADNYPSWEYEDVYFSATEWRTIDKGLSRLPAAFGPLVLNRTRFGTAVQGLTYNDTTKKVSIEYRPNNPFDLTPATESFDYAVVAVPFSRVRLWHLPPYSSLLSRAISTLHYQQACKVALHYKTRFWEHLPRPIFGGCGSTDIPGISSICYPSYHLNATGPGALLASYNSGTISRSLASLPETDHVALVQRAMVAVHGAIAAEQYTGAYDRICWENVEDQAGAWAAPTVGQQDLYLPAYFRTEYRTVFVGEHTSYTHAWIFSALESAVRGTAQLLLDMGLVDEAKKVTETWMARWISV